MCTCKDCNNRDIDERLLNMNLMGRFFGYPTCCIQEFLGRARKVLEAIPNGFAAIEKASEVSEIQKGYNSGFIPCIQCASKIKPGEEKSLIKNRSCRTPYPLDDYTDEEYEEFIRGLVL